MTQPPATPPSTNSIGVIYTHPPRPPAADVEQLAGFGAATVHEAMGRLGSLGPDLRPIQQGTAIAGPAVTVLSWPADNLMIHAAVEQCGPGDILVVASRTPCNNGLFGELFATSLRYRGVAGLIIDTGVRDTAELRQMGFPVWSRHVHVQGTVKSTPGSINVPVLIGGQVVDAGDVIVADDDGVVVVPREQTSVAVAASQARLEKEAKTRAAFEQGELGLDRYGLRDYLLSKGVQWLPHPAGEQS